MNKISNLKVALLFFFLMILMVSISACANLGAKTSEHGFEFDVRRDSGKDIELLEFKYGNSKIHSNSGVASEGRPLYSRSTYGDMLVGGFLYVRWRYIPSNEVIEKTISLHDLIPNDITGKKIYFVIKDRDIIVYLIHSEPRGYGQQENGPSLYWQRKVETIYPSRDYIYKFKKTYE
ncbi:hypothetical protein [uncultured Chitinibacter sp.]|uniref:hypothetical protein n=1 Tax=uncultured Chitinibacter sp. TaxID=1214081 RepID=UPI0025937D87|nr:hypothetical protein [uncultured Chitinibacter sp.]